MPEKSSLIAEADEILIKAGALDQARAVRDEIARLREALDLIDGVTGPYDEGYVEEVKAIVRKARAE